MSEATKEPDRGASFPAAGSQGARESQGAEQAPKGAEAAEQAGEAKSETVPRAMFEKLQADLENFKRIEDERKTKEKKRQEELLKEQGKYKELYETAQRENETMKAQLVKLDSVMKSMLETEMADLPEEFDKSLIPNIDDYDKVAWLKKAKATFVKKAEPRKGDGTPPVGGKDEYSSMRGIYVHPTSPRH